MLIDGSTSLRFNLLIWRLTYMRFSNTFFFVLLFHYLPTYYDHHRAHRYNIVTVHYLPQKKKLDINLTGFLTSSNHLTLYGSFI